MRKETIQYVDNHIAGFALSAAIAILFNTLLVWGKETYPALSSWMKALTSHHWISQGLLVVAVFLLLGFILSKSNLKFKTTTLTWVILTSSVVSAIGIIFWFILF